MAIMVAAIERNGVVMGVVLLLVLLVQIVQLHVLHNLHKTHVHDAAAGYAADKVDKVKPVQQQAYVSADVAAQPPGGEAGEARGGSQSPYVVNAVAV